MEQTNIVELAKIDYAVTVLLKEYQNIEMILLKGHLILEQALNHAIYAHVNDTRKIDTMNLMFAKKVKLLAALMGKNQLLSEYYKHLEELNRIRNKVAHELFFDKYHKELKLWACSVNRYTPKTLNRKRTYKNSVIRAFSLLTGFLIGLSIGINNVKKSKNSI